MKKQLILGTALCIGLFFSAQQISYAQEKTKAEIDLIKEQIKTEWKAEVAMQRKAKIEKLALPKSSGVASVDDLASGMGKLVVSTNENNKLIPTLYTRSLKENMDGTIDNTVKKPTVEELVALADNITAQIASTNTIMAAVPAASDDISKATPMQAPKATKALNFVKETGPLLLPELQSNLKVVNDLIVVVKSSKNY